MKDQILDFLKQLAAVQHSTISVLQRKQKLLVHPNKKELDAIAGEENDVLRELQVVLEQREEILTQCSKRGIRAESIEELCQKLLPNHFEGQRLILAAKQYARQLRYLALANWSMSQRSIIHLNQILEIIETKGQGRATYGPKNSGQSKDNAATTGGGFVDRVA